MFGLLKTFLLLFIPYKLLSRIYKTYCFIILRFIHNISSLGRGTIFFNGFKSWNGKNIKIGSDVYLEDSILSAGETSNGQIEIGDDVFFGHRVMVLARAHDYTKKGKDRVSTILEAPIKIKKGAWIASGAMILKGVTIGENAVVAAGSVITKNVEDNCIVGGNPAKLIKRI
ncbi:MAG: acyltransferase [Microgenomates group bacterium]